MTDEEYLVIEALEAKSLSIKEITEILDKKSVLGVIQGMFTKGYIDINQKIVKKYKPKKIRYARLLNSLSSEESLKKLFHSLKIPQNKNSY